MKNNIRGVLLLAIAVLSASPLCAGEQMGMKEVIELLSGNTVKGHYIVEGRQQGLMGRVRIVIKFFSDGSAEKTRYAAKGVHGQFTEKGNWLVNKKGKLCFSWAGEKKKKCGSLHRTSDGKYELHRKKQKFFYDEIVAGT